MYPPPPDTCLYLCSQFLLIHYVWRLFLFSYSLEILKHWPQRIQPSQCNCHKGLSNPSFVLKPTVTWVTRLMQKTAVTMINLKRWIIVHWHHGHGDYYSTTTPAGLEQTLHSNRPMVCQHLHPPGDERLSHVWLKNKSFNFVLFFLTVIYEVPVMYLTCITRVPESLLIEII